MEFCECLACCVGGVLYCAGAAVYYTCKYTYLGIRWCVKKIYNYYRSRQTVAVEQPTAIPVNNNVARYYTSIRTDPSRVYVPVNSNNIATGNPNNARNYISGNASTTGNRVVAPAPVHSNRKGRGGSGTKYVVVKEINGKNGPCGSGSKTGREFFIPTADVTMPTGRTVAVTIPSRPQCHCKQLSATKLIPLWPKSRMGRAEYLICSDEMNNTIQKHQSGSFSRYQIVSVHKVKNCCLWTSFRNTQTSISKENNGVVNQRMLFHGTSAADDIVRMGFDVGHANPGGLFGAGLYFAKHSSKSNQYVYGFMGRKGCPSHSLSDCSSCVRKMLLCRVTLGNSYYSTSASKKAHAPPGYHSVVGLPSTGGLLYPEYVIYKGEQAYPEYLISYKIVK